MNNISASEQVQSRWGSGMTALINHSLVPSAESGARIPCFAHGRIGSVPNCGSRINCGFERAKMILAIWTRLESPFSKPQRFAANSRTDLSDPVLDDSKCPN
jgi:hypothetical protein